MKHICRCLGLLLVLSLCACFTTPRSSLNTLWLTGDPQGKISKTLLVMLPGLHDRASYFKENGFIDAMRKNGIKTDVVLVDLHAGYYLSRSAEQALHRQLILPARRQGYQHIWLMGVSLGGMGSMLYAVEHAAQLAGLILISPFSGRGGFVETLRRADGSLHLPPDKLPLLQMDTDTLQAWVWMCNRPASEHPAVYITFGEAEPMASDIALLATCSMPAMTYRNAGKHDWGSWQLLWSALLLGPLGDALRDGG